MKKALAWLWHEFLDVLPVVIFFFIGLNIINATQFLMFHDQDITVFTFSKIVVGSLVAGKLLLVVDLLPFVNAFAERPLIYNTLWKTLVYSIAGAIYRIAEPFVYILWRYDDFSLAYRELLVEMNWPRFWGIQIWVTVLLFVIVGFRELIVRIGRGEARRIFFGQAH